MRVTQVHIQSLHELVMTMQAESPINFRKVMLVPYYGAGEAVAAAMNGGSSGSPSNGGSSSPGAAVGDAVADAVRARCRRRPRCCCSWQLRPGGEGAHS